MRVLETERLSLRWLEAADARFMLELVNDPDWQRDWLEDVDLGFAFLARSRGNGYAWEAASAILDYAESALGLTRIAAIVSPGNLASRRLLARLGLQFERMVESPLDPKEVCLYASTRPRPMADAYR